GKGSSGTSGMGRTEAMARAEKCRGGFSSPQGSPRADPGSRPPLDLLLPGWLGLHSSQRARWGWVRGERLPALWVYFHTSLWQIKSDKQLPGGVIYSIKGPGVDEEPLGIFSIDKLSGKVFLNTMLDREKNDRFRLRAFALDLGGATLEDPTDLEIVVVDQNDNRPLFQQEVFTGHVVEGAVPGTYVLKAEATDADDPDTDNAALRYSILEQGSAGLFSINETTGEIRTVQVGLDREVTVADMSGDGLATTATAVIYVDDINDNPPEFTKPEFSVEVLENTSGVDIGRLLVHDKDLPGSPNWLARFTILEGDPDGAFAIRTDPRTNDGVLSVVKALDHEGRDHFTLTVSVQNQNQLHPSAPQTTRALAMVQVQVQDVNEAPFFPKNPRLARVAEGAPPGTELITFSASDPDTRQPQALSYSLAYDPADWLLLDPRSGMVQTKRELPRRSPFLQGSWYTAVILASDKADPPSTATGTLSIEIVEVNDHGPALLPLAGVMCSEPSKGRGLLLSAMDEDLPPHAEPFHFRLSPDAPQLAHNWSLSQLNGEGGGQSELLVPVPAGLHSLPLLLSDSGTPRQERAQLLNVSVCPCDEGGSCQASAAAASTAGAGLSFGALMIILSSVILLLSLALLAAVRERCHRRPRHEGLLGSSQDDLRDNILNYDEQGGGEEDQGAYNINQLRNPDFFPLPCPPGKQPIRRDTPYSYATPPYPRKLPASPSDIEDFINEGLEAADSDPNIPPYDTALIYDCEGSGSVAGSLSSIVSSLTDGDQDYDYLSEWGPRFRRLADLYGH
uniref:Cadherin domain-containing protein n=1 Tax=Terrapene triunguis TaxID=2587831 RepID=A0A674J7Q8_9SAUR